MSQPVDPFATFDAAYVLGALSPEDRSAYEQHLATCTACARSVQELAGLPGLLAQVDTQAVAQVTAPAGLPDSTAQPPAGLLPALLGKVRTHRRRRLVAGVSAAVAAAAACIALVVAVFLPSAPPLPDNAMTPLATAPVQANASLTATSWGSSVELSCSYKDGGGSPGYGSYGADYVLVAVRHDGSEQQLATWLAVPDATARMTIGTSLSPSEIKYLEVRDDSGKALLRLPVS